MTASTASFFIGNAVVGEYAGIAFTGNICDIQASNYGGSRCFYVTLTAPMALPNEFPYNGATVKLISVRMASDGSQDYAGKMRHAPALDFCI